MIDKLEVGVKYKLIDKDGYINCNSVNSAYIREYLTSCGCLVLDHIDMDGDGCIDTDVVISNSEVKFFIKYDEDQEYRVIRRGSKHQVCDWRKGVKLYEDELGTLVRNDKRTKFYTDIVEWRYAEILPPEILKSIIDTLRGLSEKQLNNLAKEINDHISVLTQNGDTK